MNRLVPLFLLGFAPLGGCSLLQSPEPTISTTSLQASTAAEAYRQIASARQGNNVVLQVKGDEQPFRVLPLPDNGHPVFVSDLLQQTGLSDKFRRMKVDVFRNSDQAVDGIKMSVAFHPSTGQMVPSCDYALRPGDRIQVSEAPLINFGGTLGELLSM